MSIRVDEALPAAQLCFVSSMEAPKISVCETGFLAQTLNSRLPFEDSSNFDDSWTELILVT